MKREIKPIVAEKPTNLRRKSPFQKLDNHHSQEVDYDEHISMLKDIRGTKNQHMPTLINNDSFLINQKNRDRSPHKEISNYTSLPKNHIKNQTTKVRRTVDAKLMSANGPLSL